MRHNPATSIADELPSSARFRAARLALEAAEVWTRLQACGIQDARLVGTIPLGVDLPGSDLDIVCERPAVQTADEFATALRSAFSGVTLENRTARPANEPDALRIWQRTGAAGDSGEVAVVAQFEIPAAPVDQASGGDGPLERSTGGPRTSLFLVEIFADALPITQQMAWRHYLVEYTLLQRARRDGRLTAAQTEIRRLKQAGRSTEAAFCDYFGIAIPAGSDEYRVLYELAEGDH